MRIAERLLPEFDSEMANTRKVLERVPDDKLEWRAHPKSNTIGWNARHLAEIPGWTMMITDSKSLDLNPPGSEPYKTPPAKSRAEFLEMFDRNVAAARQAIAALDEERWEEPWSLLNAGDVIFTMSKYDVLRNMVLNHIIHHRAHLCVYYRLNDIPVPALYGPSGDEMGM